MQIKRDKAMENATDEGKKKAAKFETYIEDSGLAIAFKIIFLEICSKDILDEEVHSYTAKRLREIGK